MRNQFRCIIIDILESNSEKPLTEFIKTTTVLDALHFLKQAWQKVTPVCIQNCFRKAGFDLRSPIQPSLERNADDTQFNWSSLGIDEEDFDHYVTIDDDIDCYGDLTDDQIVQEVQGVPIADVDDEEVEEEEVEVPSNADTLQALHEYHTPLSGLKRSCTHPGRLLSHRREGLQVHGRYQSPSNCAYRLFQVFIGLTFCSLYCMIDI